ncbi:hypothetical protein FN846DRAFT_994036 [Sphaerosporella brunnea]|uniref:Uncharacterized protein n=1 Tax=Sphaerosporella brunnea TaxID=1250544 RepID=A0A5J5EKU8_9PEZI|nr:hypothetical protein FN846DRAFT_994036 [Sphaerosporella brunnea]
MVRAGADVDMPWQDVAHRDRQTDNIRLPAREPQDAASTDGGTSQALGNPDDSEPQSPGDVIGEPHADLQDRIASGATRIPPLGELRGFIELWRRGCDNLAAIAPPGRIPLRSHVGMPVCGPFVHPKLAIRHDDLLPRDHPTERMYELDLDEFVNSLEEAYQIHAHIAQRRRAPWMRMRRQWGWC